jgi:predicted nucleic acid-binding protein
MLLFWDASALAKRYFTEEGSPTVNALFAQVTPHDMASTPWGYAETYSILLRRHNQGTIDAAAFTNAANLLRAEIIEISDFTLLSLTDAHVFDSLEIMYRHHLNATDATILALLLVTLPSPIPADFVLIAADQRLLRAANAEGMRTLNPATLAATEVATFLSSL